MHDVAKDGGASAALARQVAAQLFEKVACGGDGDGVRRIACGRCGRVVCVEVCMSMRMSMRVSLLR